MGIPFFHRMSVRVLVGSIILLMFLFGMYSYFTIRIHNEQMMKQLLGSANRMSDVIKQSTHYSMLLNRKEDVYQIITMIGKEPGVEGIRIYNKRGEIMFSTDKKEERSVVDMHAEACYACHDREKPLASLSIDNRVRIYDVAKGYRVLGLINPIRNEPSCSNSDCHAHPADRTVLGVLDVRMSLEALDSNIVQAQQTMTVSSIVMIVIVALISVIFLSLTVIHPVQQLMKGAQEISTGNLDHQITIRTRDELGTLAQAFNEMTSSLRHEKEENRSWAETLQERIREKTYELRAMHRQILHIEKMASLGKLSATVAHELNNPLEAILTYAKLIARRIKRDESAVHLNQQTLEDIQFIARETDRCGTIVKNLLLFSKKQVGEVALVPAQQIIEKASELVRHHCKISNVELRVNYSDGDVSLMCDENQVQQALVALFVNAVEAMPDGGTITVEVSRSKVEESVIITVSDTGLGIVPENLPHIFEPFFTTKKEGKGVGLGLSVVYGIVERHGGRISAQSHQGGGTMFTIVLPSISRMQNESPEQSSIADLERSTS